MKRSALVEFLAERASEDYEPINFNFFDEDLMAVSHDEEDSSEKNCWRLHFDRASNALAMVLVLF